MSELEIDPRIAAARRAYAAMKQDALGSSPLAAISEWVATGSAPLAHVLRDQGFVADAPQTTPEEAKAELDRRLMRSVFSRRWGFSIPCGEAVEVLRALAPIVEVGAGTGYWSALLRAAGHDAIATDAQRENWGDGGYTPERPWPVERLTGDEAVRKYPERDVFCSWPTDGDGWALGMAWAMRPGQRLAVILTPGNTGTKGLRRYLVTRFAKLGEIVLPQFPDCADTLSIWRKL